MDWQIGLVVAAVVGFFGLRFTARGWIIDRWIDGRLTSFHTAVLLGLIYLAPLLILLLPAILIVPESLDGTILLLLLTFVPLVAVLGGLLDYAVINGVKGQLRQKRAASLARLKR